MNSDNMIFKKIILLIITIYILYMRNTIDEIYSFYYYPCFQIKNPIFPIKKCIIVLVSWAINEPNDCPTITFHLPPFCLSIYNIINDNYNNMIYNNIVIIIMIIIISWFTIIL